MNRLTGIIFAGVGVVVAVLGFSKVLPNTGATGIYLVLLGGLLFGLSFIQRPDAIESEPMSFPVSLLAIFYSPTEVFRNLRRHPRFLSVIVVMSVISGVYTFTFFNRLTPERITNHTVDKIAESGWVPEAQIPQIRQETLEANSQPLARAAGVVNGFVGTAFIVAFVGWIFCLITLAFGGKMNYWQSVAATAYAFFPITLIQKGFSFLILFLKDAADIHPILGQTTLLHDSLNFLIAPSDSPVLYTLLSSISILSIYSVWLLATGLKNAGERVTPSTAWTSSVIVWSVGVMISLIAALLFGNFIT